MGQLHFQLVDVSLELFPDSHGLRARLAFGVERGLYRVNSSLAVASAIITVNNVSGLKTLAFDWLTAV